MDRYDRIIHDIQRKTDEGIIQWTVVNAGRYSDIVLNAFRVIRAFKAEYPVGDKFYEILFVERRVEYHDEFGDSTEGYGFELFILDNDKQIVLSLYEGVVDRDDLLKLSGLIDERNDRVQQFFSAFDAPGAA